MQEQVILLNSMEITLWKLLAGSQLLMDKVHGSFRIRGVLTGERVALRKLVQEVRPCLTSMRSVLPLIQLLWQTITISRYNNNKLTSLHSMTKMVQTKWLLIWTMKWVTSLEVESLRVWRKVSIQNYEFTSESYWRYTQYSLLLRIKSC